MSNPYFKIVLSNMFFMVSHLIAAGEDGNLPPQDDELHTPPSYKGSLSPQGDSASTPSLPEHPFDILMNKLRTIELVDRTLEP